MICLGLNSQCESSCDVKWSLHSEWVCTGCCCFFFSFSKSVLIKSYLICCRLVTGRQISSTTGLWRRWIQLGTDLKWKTGELRYTEHKDELQLIPSWSALTFFSQKRRFERSCNYTALSIPLLTKTHHTYWWLESFSAAETWSTCVDLHFKPAARRLPWSKKHHPKSQLLCYRHHIPPTIQLIIQLKIIHWLFKTFMYTHE